ncbi:hypothetical protein [Leucobacter sp. 1207-22]|uniref:hypothetical protein n=1 Tax=Leucobacter sp. 1207-22 TaxID=2604456 RepID=UPI0040628470
MMPINAPYSDAEMWAVWAHDPRPEWQADGSVKVSTIMKLEQERRLNATAEVLAAATTVAVVRFPKQHMLHGAINLGLPSPMWLIEVDRQYEAGWVLSRRVADIDEEARSCRDAWKAQRNAAAEKADFASSREEMQSSTVETKVMAALADRLGGHVVERYLNPLHVRVKLRMVNLFEGWPHVDEVRQWLDQGHSEEVLREAGEQSYRQMQTFHGLSRAEARRTATQKVLAT